MGRALRDHFLRIDARSLGLFRIAFGLVLVGDLVRRWAWLRAFYSNEGVLPNHNHLFNLRDKEQVWSVLHAFSTPGENHFAFTVALLVYLGFLLGVRTRVFQVLSLVALVSLTGRNILFENAGNYAAIALLAFTLFLPLGSRFSVDALRASFAARDEKSADELNDRSPIGARPMLLSREAGWSPVSIAALGVQLQLAVLFVCAALQQTGAPWRDGSALYYALHSDRLATELGATVREAVPFSLLKVWSFALYGFEWAIPALLLLPFARRFARGAAVVAMLVYGLTFGLLLSFGLFGWTIVAAAALAIPTESWDALAKRGHRASRVRTVIYDADCGICLWLARLVRRLDHLDHLTLQGNDEIEAVLRRGADGSIERAAPPASLTPELVSETVVTVAPDGSIATRARAVADVVAALPLGRPIAFVMRLPGLVHLLDALYGFVAARRHRLSELCGMAACGLPEPAAEPASDPEPGADGEAGEVAPALRTARTATGLLRELGAAAVLAAMLVQTSRANALPVKLPAPSWLTPIATWPRMMARWDVLAPAPPTEEAMLVIDAQTRGGKSIDPLTGREPITDLASLRGSDLGQLWADYLDRIRQNEYNGFQKAFRDYVAKGGPRWLGQQGDALIVGLDAYWVKQPIPPPGAGPQNGEVERHKIFTHSRGGRLGLDRVPLVRPEILRK